MFNEYVTYNNSYKNKSCLNCLKNLKVFYHKKCSVEAKVCNLHIKSGNVLRQIVRSSVLAT